MSTPHRLRALLHSGELTTAPGVFDGVSASLAGRLGLAAAYLTGACVPASGFGLRPTTIEDFRNVVGLREWTALGERYR